MMNAKLRFYLSFSRNLAMGVTALLLSPEFRKAIERDDYASADYAWDRLREKLGDAQP